MPSQMLRTPLYDLHVKLEAKMVPFAGYDMPVQYSGIRQEHLHTRSQAGLFDVSHMGQFVLKGSGVVAALEALLPIDIEKMAIGEQNYAFFTNKAGGIQDDLIVSRWGQEEIFLVVNAACKQQDYDYINAFIPNTVSCERLDNALLALQGPKAVTVLERLFLNANSTGSNLNGLAFMHGQTVNLQQVLKLEQETSAQAYISRSVYTGEDGFEISLPEKVAEAFALLLLEQTEVQFSGLGARDSLRLEAGLCLYGHDMTTTTTPIEAGLRWAIDKSRRPDGSKAGGFPGADIIFQQMAEGTARKRIGLSIQSKVPVREGAVVETIDGETCGQVCSGGFSPSLATPIAMAYVDSEFGALDTQLIAKVRGKSIPITVTHLPFVPHQYVRKPSA